MFYSRSSVTFNLLLFFVITTSSTSAQTVESDGEIMKRLFHNYDKTVNPRTDSPTTVKIGIYINDIDLHGKDPSIRMYFRQSWNDPRLTFTRSGDGGGGKLRVYSPDMIWVPDTFFRNEKSGHMHKVTVDNRLMTIKENGDVWYVMKLSLTLKWPKYLQKFPADRQILPLLVESFGHTMSTLVLTTLRMPIDVDSHISINGFTVRTADPLDCSQNYTSGAYPCLEFRLHLDRDIGSQVISTVLPSAFFVVLSWSSFGVPITLPSVKLTTSLLTTLVSATLKVVSRPLLAPELMNVGYVTVLDIWVTSCLLFVVACFIFQLVLVRRSAGGSSQDQRHGDKPTTGSGNLSRIEKVGLIVFPVSFLLYAIIFWVSATR